MTKKHFEAFAEAIRTITNCQERQRVAEMIAGVCQQSNGRFDTRRFFRACNV